MNELTTTAPKPPIVLIRERFEARKIEIKNQLPSDISPDVFIRAMMTSCQLNPELQACTFASLWDACMRACRAGLLPDGIEAAVVPFKGRAQFIPMVQGVLRSARRSGQLKWIDANVVRQGEAFEYSITQDGPRFNHVPGDDFKAPILRAYAAATTKDGGFFTAVMSLAEINKHRAFSRAAREDSPWNQWFEAMAIKTAIKALGKFLPSVRDAVSQDDTLDDVPDKIAPTVAFERAAEQPATEGQRFGPGEAIQSPTDARAPDAGDTPSESPGGEQEHGEPDAPAAAPDPVADAYERGKEAKSRGHQRRALPPEYRDQTRTREALAWTAGHDGGPMPASESQPKEG